MKTLRAPGAALVLLLTVAPVVAAQDASPGEEADSECVEICRAFPSRAPAECSCNLILAGGGTSDYTLEDLLEMRPEQIVAIERAAYLERMEGISEFWVIERSSVTPVPTIIPYTRDAPGTWPPFREVTQPELQRHWLETNPNLTAEQRAQGEAVAANPGGAVAGMGEGIQAFMGALADEIPIPGLDEFGGDLAAKFDSAAMSIAQTLAEDSAQDEEFSALLDATEDIWKDAKVFKGLYFPNTGPLVIGKRRIHRPTGRESADPRDFTVSDVGAAELTRDTERGESALCVVLIYDSQGSDSPNYFPQHPTGPAIEITGTDGIDYTITRAEKWLAFHERELVPIYIRLEITALHKRGVLHRETTKFGWDKSIFHPGTIRQGFEELTRAMTARYTREVGGVNEMPTQADFVDTFGEAGFPGMGPIGSEWP